MQQKPIIGIAAQNNALAIESGKPRSTFIRESCVESTLKAGGVPIGILPTEIGCHAVRNHRIKPEHWSTEEKENLYAQMRLCDGIMLMGGTKITRYYRLVAKFAFDNDIPCIGFCGGEGAMVKALGGSDAKSINADAHDKKGIAFTHPIFVTRGTQLHRITGKDEFMVNSAHTFSSKKIPKELIVSARDPDGNNEVMEAPSKRFYIAVRFHPETNYDRSEDSRKIFAAFIDACTAYRAQKAAVQRRKPVIGLMANTEKSSSRPFVWDEERDAVLQAGGIALMIVPMKDEQALQAQTALCNDVIDTTPAKKSSFSTARQTPASTPSAAAQPTAAAPQSSANTQDDAAQQLKTADEFALAKDFSNAVIWYTKAADAGSADATFNLALCYLNGLGVTADANVATALIIEAARLGHEGALNILKK
ncbi:MAG: gamma-glutamyl-gamma-aminobutyrate hydrolase family protein [Firmicutes bacterium]|nr:gamma-glutamyl-gamma-aminobutyrate hydrolase family protein [Bacillota bacterium]